MTDCPICQYVDEACYICCIGDGCEHTPFDSARDAWNNLWAQLIEQALTQQDLDRWKKRSTRMIEYLKCLLVKRTRQIHVGD